MKRWALIFLAAISLAAVCAPWLARYSYDEQNLEERLQAPSMKHWMGTDSLGRDLFSRVLFGARLSLLVAVATALASLFIGTVFGGISGFVGGWLDEWMMRIVDVLYIFPSLLLTILVMMYVGQNAWGIVLSLSTVGWVMQARLVRGLVLQLKELPHVEAARALGASPVRILWKHIFPLAWGPILVSVAFQVPANMMTESFLSFIGLGLQPPYASWGTLANEGWRALQSYPHLIIFPGLALFSTVLSFQILGQILGQELSRSSQTIRTKLL